MNMMQFVPARFGRSPHRSKEPCRKPLQIALNDEPRRSGRRRTFSLTATEDDIEDGNDQGGRAPLRIIADTSRIAILSTDLERRDRCSGRSQ